MSKLTTSLTVRIAKSLRQKFRAKAKKYGDPSEVHRELIEAFVDGRLKIEPKSETHLGELYNDN